jgi:hypothetical protein
MTKTEKAYSVLLKRRTDPRNRDGGWVNTKTLARNADSYAVHSIISKLRHIHGFVIETKKDPNGNRYWYRLS